MKNNLKDTTFIIPVRIESADRMRNAITSICFLLENFDTNVIVKEGDEGPKFSSLVLPQIKAYFQEEYKNLNLTILFEKTEGPEFHRTRYLNEMLDIVTTKVVVNYDCDVILPIDSYVQAQKLIVEETSDVVYPYGLGNYSRLVNFNDKLATDFLTNDFDYNIFDNNSKINTSRYGWCQFFNTEVYKNNGKENEEFIAYAPEDEERAYRFQTLGFKVDRIDNLVYHLEHERSENSWFNNPHMQNNFALWEKIKVMNKNQLIEYYNL